MLVRQRALNQRFPNEWQANLSTDSMAKTERKVMLAAANASANENEAENVTASRYLFYSAR